MARISYAKLIEQISRKIDDLTICHADSDNAPQRPGLTAIF